MNCEHARDRLGAWIDGELAPDEDVLVEEHVSSCEECRLAAESLRQLDGLVETGTRDLWTAADAVVERVVAALDDESPEEPTSPHEPARRRRWRDVVSIVAAMACGFLIAVLAFRPWEVRERVEVVERLVPRPKVVDERDPTTVPGVARVVRATGPLSVRTEREPNWTTVAELSTFQCPTNAELRTEPGTRAELETIDGCVIRLNDETEVRMRSARTVELGRGQMWCRSPEDVQLEVLARDEPEPAPTRASCATDRRASDATAASLWTMLGDAGLRVTTAEGRVALRAGDEERRLERGESVVVRRGRIVEGESVDPLLDTAWIHPLLVRDDGSGSELEERVDAYLARIGLTKVSYLYEREIRSLGDHAALPLLRFVQSPLSKEHLERRRRAATILADLATVDLISDLIALLADEDPTVRVATARALERLTGETQGRSPSDWSAPPEENDTARDYWDSWWEVNEKRYPTSRTVPSRAPLAPTPGDGD